MFLSNKHLLHLVHLHDLGSFLMVFHAENWVSPHLTLCEWQIYEKRYYLSSYVKKHMMGQM